MIKTGTVPPPTVADWWSWFFITAAVGGCATECAILAVWCWTDGNHVPATVVAVLAIVLTVCLARLAALGVLMRRARRNEDCRKPRP